MLRRVCLIVLACASLVHAADEPAPYTHEDFVTSYWCGPPARLTTLERYQEIKEANFTVTFPIYGGATPKQIRDSLDFSQQLGMKAVIHDGRMPLSIGGSEAAKKALDAIVKDYADHPALLAYHITDEPDTPAFAGLGEVNAYLKEKDPKHPGYINLYPNYAKDYGAFGGDTYEQHVEKFLKIVKPAWLSYDHYAMTAKGDRPSFFANLATMREISMKADVPFWNIVLVTQHAGYRNLTEPELRFQAMQTIAFGARGLVWFTYWSPAEFDKTFNWEHAMINPDGSRTPHYDMVKAINADVLAIGRELKHTKSVAIAQGGGIAGARFNTGTSPLKIESGMVTAGVFKSPAGVHLALLANRNYMSSETAKIRLENSERLERFDPAKGVWSAMELPADNSFQAELSAGAATLIRWSTRDADVR